MGLFNENNSYRRIFQVQEKHEEVYGVPAGMPGPDGFTAECPADFLKKSWGRDTSGCHVAVFHLKNPPAGGGWGRRKAGLLPRPRVPQRSYLVSLQVVMIYSLSQSLSTLGRMRCLGVERSGDDWAVIMDNNCVCCLCCLGFFGSIVPTAIILNILINDTMLCSLPWGSLSKMSN